MDYNRYFILFCFVFLFFKTPSELQASQIAPSNTSWGQINTKHFHIMYNKDQLDLGLYYSKVAETAYSNLSTVFTTLPEEITVVISDNTDSSNGNATVFPYPLIFAYPVLVGQQDSLSEAGEWGKELLTHELTHIAQLYPYSGWGYKIARGIFGSIVSPLLLMPNWWKEGMAVEVETQFSPQGRSRSYLQDAQIRSYVTKNKLADFTMAQANENLITWPYNNRQYFFGSMIMSQMAKDGKPSTLGKLVSEQSSRAPYFINGPVEDIFDLNFSSVYDKTLLEFKKNADAQIKELQKISISEPHSIDEHLLQSKTIQYSEAQKLIGFLATTEMKTELQFYKKTTNGNFEKLDLNHSPNGGIGLFSFHPTLQKIIYSKIHGVSLQQSFSDLFIYDIANDKVETLTENERARDPVYSADGNFALYLKVSDGITELKQIEIATKKIQSIVKTNYSERINSYTYKNSNEILFTVRNKIGEQQLRSYNLALPKQSIITSPKQIRFIKYKNETLYFTSTENEVSNVYSSKIINNIIKETKPLTHLLTGALSFDVDEKNNLTYATLIGENGPFVASIPFLKSNLVLPKINNEILSRYKEKTDENADTSSTLTDYSSLNYIYPHYWIPFVSTNITGNGLLYQALTSASDPIGNHSYAAQLNYDSFSNRMGYLFSYMNTQLPWAWNISAFQTQQLLGIQTYVRKNIYSLGIFPDTFFINEDLRFSFGAVMNQTEDPTASTNHLGGFLQFVYSDINQKANHYFPMSGFSLLGKYENLLDQNSQTNSRYGNYSQGLLSFTSYNHLFLPKDHTLMLKFDGLYTFEDVANRFGTSNLSLPVDAEQQPIFLIRGYQAGQFLGTQMGTLNLEYRFPILNFSKGWGTAPFFIKYLTAGIVADALAVKGYGYNAQETYSPLTLTEQVYSAGLEARLSTTVGYVLPVNFIYGLYFPMSKKFTNDSVVAGLNLQIGGF